MLESIRSCQGSDYIHLMCLQLQDYLTFRGFAGTATEPLRTPKIRGNHYTRFVEVLKVLCSLNCLQECFAHTRRGLEIEWQDQQQATREYRTKNTTEFQELQKTHVLSLKKQNNKKIIQFMLSKHPSTLSQTSPQNITTPSLRKSLIFIHGEYHQHV